MLIFVNIPRLSLGLRKGLNAWIALSVIGLHHPLTHGQQIAPGGPPWTMPGTDQGRPLLPASPETSKGRSSAPPRYSGRPAPGYLQGGDSQPDLTGRWRGTGGETVVIRGNRARIWGGRFQSCECVFFVVGDRLIAYSPETDLVRKYQFRGNHDIFSLIDDEGQLMSFWRVR